MSHPSVPPVDRATASAINPLISILNTRDSLEVMSRMVSCMGFLLSQIDNPTKGSLPEFGNLYLLFETVSAALAYESSNPRFPGSDSDKLPAELASFLSVAESGVCHD